SWADQLMPQIAHRLRGIRIRWSVSFACCPGTEIAIQFNDVETLSAQCRSTNGGTSARSTIGDDRFVCRQLIVMPHEPARGKLVSTRNVPFVVFADTAHIKQKVLGQCF